MRVRRSNVFYSSYTQELLILAARHYESSLQAPHLCDAVFAGIKS